MEPFMIDDDYRYDLSKYRMQCWTTGFSRGQCLLRHASRAELGVLDLVPVAGRYASGRCCLDSTERRVIFRRTFASSRADVTIRQRLGAARGAISNLLLIIDEVVLAATAVACTA